MRVNGLFGWVRRNDARSAIFLIGFALLLQPMAMAVLFAPLVYVDPAHAPWYNWGGYGARYVPVVALIAAAHFAVQMWRQVNAVRRDLAFRFVDHSDEPRLCGLIEPLAIAVGLQAPYVGVIESRAMNAFACGVIPKTSALVFTRGLIDGLDDDELSAIIAHELIHIRNGDTRMIAAANVFMQAFGLLTRANVIKPRRYRQIAAILLAPILFPLYLGVAGVAQLLLRLGYASRLLISSSREFNADAEAMRLTQDPGALVSALQRIESGAALTGLPLELDAMMIVGATKGRLATHPAIRDRIAAIFAVTGSMALDVRPRRDTRNAFQRGLNAAVISRGSAIRESVRQFARVAATGATPNASALSAFLSVGGDGELSVFGMRWDMAAAMLATFCTAAVLNHGDMFGLLGGMARVLERPDRQIQSVLDKARACQGDELSALVGRHPTIKSCDDMLSAAAKLPGFNRLADGRFLTDGQLMMLSPEEIGRSGGFRATDAALPRGVFISNRREAGAVSSEAATPDDQPAIYLLPLHETWSRLANGNLSRYLFSEQCGLLVHVSVEAQTDRLVIWRVLSEGEERIRFTAELSADGPEATRVKLYVWDQQPHKPVVDGRTGISEPVVFRPALSAPLRPAFSEALAAMIEDRLFRIERVQNRGVYSPGDGTTAGLCMNQRDRLIRSGEHFSIHDEAF